MSLGALIYYLVILVMTAWPVWLIGGVSCLVLWHVSKSWHPFAQLLSRSFLMALTFTPSFFEGHPPALAPAIYAFFYEASEEWLPKGIFPILVGWLVIFSIPVVIVLVQTVYERHSRNHSG
jgi:hypothetical protein